MPIKLTVRKPKAIMFDVFGTVVKTGVIQDVFFPLITANVEQFLRVHWNNKVVAGDVERLRKQSTEDAGPAIQSGDNVDAVRQSVVDYVITCNNNRRDNDAIRIFRLVTVVLFDGFLL